MKSKIEIIEKLVEDKVITFTEALILLDKTDAIINDGSTPLRTAVPPNISKPKSFDVWEKFTPYSDPKVQGLSSGIRTSGYHQIVDPIIGPIDYSIIYKDNLNKI